MIEVYLRVFINWEQNDQARLLLMAEFAYNNAKNTSINHTLFKLNYRFHLQVLFEADANTCSTSRLANKLADKLSKLIEVCCQTLLHVQELQKKAYDKGVKSRNYFPSEKVWLNNKYIKTKWNKQLKNKFLNGCKFSMQ